MARIAQARELKPRALPLKVQAGPPVPNRTELAERAVQKNSDVPLAHSHSPTGSAVKRPAAAVSKGDWLQAYLRTPGSIRFVPKRWESNEAQELALPDG